MSTQLEATFRQGVFKKWEAEVKMETSILIEGFGKSTSTVSAAEDSRRNQQFMFCCSVGGVRMICSLYLQW